MLKVLLVSGLLLTAAPAVAQTQATPASTAPQAKSKDDPDRVICQNQEQIGSRIATKRVCMTAAQWKEHDAALRQQLDQQHTTTQNAGGPG
ncbi:MAG TPA: hypothetical protein VHE36_14305 [Sphingomicrobium sp.]|jgi:invasion protein IalB|nr:hypothetical protein [Sphingomicrobium sp.]